MPRLPILSLCLAFALALGACATQPDYAETYRLGHYAEAYQEAAAVASKLEPGPARDRAALVAGMAAEASDRDDDATRWLTPLTSNADDSIAGKASATLGMMAYQRRQWLVASHHLQSAAKHLTGDDAARCAVLAGDCLAQVGMAAQANAQYAAATKDASTPAVKQIIDARSKGPFAVQFGAFRDRAKAQQVATGQQKLAALAGQSTRVDSAVDALGRTVWAVRAGKYATRAEAVAAQQKMGASVSAVVAVRN